MSYETIKVSQQDSVCFIQLDRPLANNSISGLLVRECSDALSRCEQSTAVVLSGSKEVFCMGADFDELNHDSSAGVSGECGPEALYNLWLQLATGPYVTVAHVRGKANAGGIGFVAACDIALADESAQFSLSELLFGLYPACVLPFLVRRVGSQRAHYMTLSTFPVNARNACAWGLVDIVENDSDSLLRRHLLRLRRLSPVAIRRYKKYMQQLASPLAEMKSTAVAGNREVFSDADNLAAIARYIERGVFPWEKS